MNEIITRLNEIEEKANCILEDAGSRKKQMMLEYEKEKQALDEKYERLQVEELRQFEENLRRETRSQIELANENARTEIERLEIMFAEKKEELADGILERVIQ